MWPGYYGKVWLKITDRLVKFSMLYFQKLVNSVATCIKINVQNLLHTLHTRWQHCADQQKCIFVPRRVTFIVSYSLMWSEVKCHTIRVKKGRSFTVEKTKITYRRANTNVGDMIKRCSRVGQYHCTLLLNI